MYCQNCGGKLGDNDKFCAGCGTATPLAANVQPTFGVGNVAFGQNTVATNRCLSCGAKRENGKEYCTSCFVPFNNADLTKYKRLKRLQMQSDGTVSISRGGISGNVIFAYIMAVASLITVIILRSELKDAYRVYEGFQYLFYEYLNSDTKAFIIIGVVMVFLICLLTVLFDRKSSKQHIIVSIILNVAVVAVNLVIIFSEERIGFEEYYRIIDSKY